MCEHDTVAIPIGENNQPIGMVNDPDTVCEALARSSTSRFPERTELAFDKLDGAQTVLLLVAVTASATRL
jgi:hypothetical protein